MNLKYTVCQFQIKKIGTANSPVSMYNSYRNFMEQNHFWREVVDVG